MKQNILAVVVLAAALLVVGAVFRQEKELRRLEGAVAELRSLAREETANSTTASPLPADIEELRREAAEVHRLRAEITQLRQDQMETRALQARIDKLALEASAILANFSPQASHASSPIQSSPEEAARWVAALPPGEEQERAALAVIDRWTAMDPAAAAAWTTQFAEGPLREQALSSIARQWGLRDWNAAAGWLEKLPAGQSRDAAIGAFVTSADGYDIRLALEWANRMESAESRAMRVEETARRWLREDNAAARAWLETAELPSGLAELLLSAK